MSRLMIATVLLGALSACTGGGDKAALPPPKPAQAAAAPAPAPAPTLPEKGTELAAEPSAAPLPEEKPSEAAQSRFSGEVDAPRRSQIAFRVTGFIQDVLAKPGTKLKKGEPLATLDARDYQIRLELAKAKFAQARVATESANKDYQREEQLKNENASTAAALDKMKAAYDSAKLAQRLAELDVQAADLALQDTRLVAPYDCVVATQMKHEGENVQSGNAVFEVYDVATPEISLAVPERMMSQIAVGAALRVSVPSAGFAGKAEVVRLVPVVSEKTRTFQVTAKLVDQDPRIVPGSYAEATLN